jgi:hypothetical protein
MVFHLPLIEPPADSIIHQRIKQVGQEQAPWNHPAVVVAKWEEGGKQCVSIRLCTTFGGVSVQERKPEHQQKFFLLADNEVDQEPHGNTCLAKMETGSGFSKRTYVNLSHNSVYPIEYKHLDRYGTKPPMRFDSEARNIILNPHRY